MSARPAEALCEHSLRPKVLELQRLSTAEEQSWDQYVMSHALATPFHLTAWKRTIEESFPYKPYYLMLHDGTSVRGILPLFYVRNPVIGRVLLSTPFAVYGGILADTEEGKRILYDTASDLAARLECEYVEFRNSHPEQCVKGANVHRYVAFHTELPATEDELIAALPKKTRNMVRKALKNEFETRIVRDPERFEKLHARNMRRLGTPNFPPRYFERLLANFGQGMSDVREVWLNGTLMGVSLNIFFRQDMHTYHAASDVRQQAFAPNTFLYYDQLRWAATNGFRTFDFGRCKRNTGVFEFKKHWNTIMRELPYEILLVKRKTLPNFSPANPKFDLAIRIWRSLPMPIARAASRLVFPLFP